VTDKEKIDRLHKLLIEARIFLMARGVYYYSNERRGPASHLVDRIDAALETKDESYGK